MANRLFEVGDMVILIDNEQAIITHVFMSHVRLSCQSGYFSTVSFDKIKHIRTPRKGSKEARDIVAMLASLHRKHLKQMMKGWTIGVLENNHKDAIKYFWARRKRKDEFILRSSGYIEYQKAKSMLKKTPKQEVINE